MNIKWNLAFSHGELKYRNLVKNFFELKKKLAFIIVYDESCYVMRIGILLGINHWQIQWSVDCGRWLSKV